MEKEGKRGKAYIVHWDGGRDLEIKIWQEQYSEVLAISSKQICHCIKWFLNSKLGHKDSTLILVGE